MPVLFLPSQTKHRQATVTQEPSTECVTSNMKVLYLRLCQLRQTKRTADLLESNLSKLARIPSLLAREGCPRSTCAPTAPPPGMLTSPLFSASYGPIHRKRTTMHRRHISADHLANMCSLWYAWRGCCGEGVTWPMSNMLITLLRPCRCRCQRRGGNLVSRRWCGELAARVLRREYNQTCRYSTSRSVLRQAIRF